MAKTPEEQLGVSLPDPEPVELPEPELAAEEPAAAERPEWLPENYKDEQAFVKAHNDLRAEFNKRNEHQRELETRLQQYEQYVAQQQQQQQPQDDGIREQWDAAFEADPLNTMQYMAEQAALRAAQQVAGQQAQQYAPQFQAQNEILAANVDMLMERRYEDWNDVKERVGEVLQREQYMLPDSAFTAENPISEVQRRLDTAYKLVKAEDLLSEQEQLREQGLQQADISRARKLQAGTLPGASGRAEQLSEADQQLAAMKKALHGSSWTALRESQQR